MSRRVIATLLFDRDKVIPINEILDRLEKLKKGFNDEGTCPEPDEGKFSLVAFRREENTTSIIVLKSIN